MNESDDPRTEDSRGYYRRMQSAIEELLILKGVFSANDHVIIDLKSDEIVFKAKKKASDSTEVPVQSISGS